ncbi:MAG: site-specific integrase [Clostridiales bacterium]|nr:site-specific integrase [Clostridiales bacterium]
MSGSIEKRGINTYRLVVPGGSSNGKRIKFKKTITIDGKTEAAKMRKAKIELAKFVAEVDSNTYIEPAKMTFNDLCTKWIKDYGETNLAPKTLFRYKEMLNSRILPAMGHLKIEKIKPLHLVEFYKNLQESGIRKDGKPGGLSAQTIKHHHRLIHAIFETAVKEWDLLAVNPAANIKPPKVPKCEAKFYEEADIKALLAALDTLPESKLKYKLAVYIDISTGLRLGELMGLKWGHINMQTGIISIVEATQYLPKMGTFEKSPKTVTSNRVLVLPAITLSMLKNYKLQQNEYRLKMGSLWNNTDFVFTQRNGSPMNTYTFSRWFPKFLKSHNLKKITFHQLRHTNATMLLSSGMDLKTVSKLLGHANISTTGNIYAHALQTANKTAAEKINTLLSDAK